jgi:hypothetical protein
MLLSPGIHAALRNGAVGLALVGLLWLLLRGWDRLIAAPLEPRPVPLPSAAVIAGAVARARQLVRRGLPLLMLLVAGGLAWWLQVRHVDVLRITDAPPRITPRVFVGDPATAYAIAPGAVRGAGRQERAWVVNASSRTVRVWHAGPAGSIIGDPVPLDLPPDTAAPFAHVELGPPRPGDDADLDDGERGWLELAPAATP